MRLARDGAIRHVLSGVNPQGCQVFSFKQPSVEELEHDFLWRTTCRLPESGCMGIFSRSYCEDVLIVRVHPKILHDQGLLRELIDGARLIVSQIVLDALGGLKMAYPKTTEERRHELESFRDQL